MLQLSVTLILVHFQQILIQDCHLSLKSPYVHNLYTFISKSNIKNSNMHIILQMLLKHKKCKAVDTFASDKGKLSNN